MRELRPRRRVFGSTRDRRNAQFSGWAWCRPHIVVRNLVATFIALGDLEFLFGDLFQTYDVGIGPRYLKQFETFVLDHNVRPVDCIAQHLIVLHSANWRPDRAEPVVWDIDIACLDIDQVPV